MEKQKISKQRSQSSKEMAENALEKSWQKGEFDECAFPHALSASKKTIC